MADKPISVSYHPISFGTIEISSWPDGRRTARVRLDSSLRTPPDRWEGEDDESFKKRQEKYDDFSKYGRIRIHGSDAPNLIDVLSCIRSDLKITVETGGLRP